MSSILRQFPEDIVAHEEGKCRLRHDLVLPKLVAFVVTGECPEQGVRRGGKRVGHRDTTPRETLLQILREEQSASGFCRPPEFDSTSFGSVEKQRNPQP